MPLIVQRHLEHMRQRGLAESTIYQRARNLARLEAFTGCPAVEATAEQLAAWRASLSLADDSIASYVSHVREFFSWALAAGLVDDNPVARLPVPRLGRRLPRPMGEQDLFEALAAAVYPIRQWLVLAGWCGLRAKEIALLRRSCVLEHARPPVILVAGDATKGNRERIVPMAVFVLEELLPVLPPSGWVFRRADGQPGPNQPYHVSHLTNRFLHAHGFGETLHQLRHRFGTATYAACRDLRVVQELLGHASPLTAAGYAAWNRADAAAAVEALPVPRHLRLVAQQTENEA